MNILILSWRGPGHPNAGGAETSTFEHAKAWKKAGHRVTIFTSFFKGADSHEVVEGIDIIRKGGDVFDVQLRAFIWYLLQNSSKFDLVIDEFHGIPFFTPLYVRVKKLAWIHEVASEVWWLNPWPKPLNIVPGIIGTVFEPFVFKFFYSRLPFMTVSESTKKDLTKMGISESYVHVIYNGASVVKLKASKENKKTLTYLGALSKDKGIEDALRAFALIKKNTSDWQFWVVGKATHKYEIEIKTLVQELNMDKYIKFWGYVSEKKKFELLKRSHVLINPSYLEGWGMVNIEANFCGVPVVCYNVRGMKDSVINGTTGVLVNKGDYKKLAKAVQDLIANGKKYNTIKNNAIKWSKKFSWKKSTLQSLRLIESI